MEIDQTESELRLHRVLWLIKLLRAMVLHVLLAAFAAALYFLAGIENAYPVATAFFQALRAQAIDDRLQGGSFGSVGFALTVSIVLGAFLALLVWMYRSITNVRPFALRFQAVSMLVLGCVSVVNALPELRFAWQNLSLAFSFLAALGVAMLAVIPVSVAFALFAIARLRERSSFVATLDQRLAPNPWVYLNKLLDLPRTPLATPRTALAYALALAGAVLMIASILYLLTVGGVSNKLAALAVAGRHGLTPEAISVSSIEAQRILLLLVCAMAGVKLAAFLQSTAKRLGGLGVSEVMKGRDDRFLLYLRPFDLDEVVLPPPRLSLGSRLLSLRPYPVRIEEELFDVADGYRPLIAVGKPGGSGASRGGVAYRAYLDDAEWQGYVTDRIRRAERIVMVLKETDGVRWEFERVLAEGAVSRTLFLLHPDARNPRDWGAMQSLVVRALQRAGVAPPGFAFRARPIAFFVSGAEIVEIANANWSATSYRTAFSQLSAR